MAYKKQFNPDALPAHAEPDQAAQALAQFDIGGKPINSQRLNATPPNNQTRPPYSDPSRPRPQQQQQQQQHPKPPPQSRPYSNQAYQGQSQSQYNQQHNQRPSPNNYNQNYNQKYNQNYNQNYTQRASSSPPAQGTQGWGSRPAVSQPGQQWSSAHNYPPRTPAPPDPDSADLYPLFRAANASGSGSLTKGELGSALVNADFTPFDPRTIHSLMRMFSRSPPGQPGGPTVSYDEFQNMWRFLAEWRNLFERFDEDHSGRISFSEFSNALVNFGYRMSSSFTSVIYNFYTGNNMERRGSRGMVQSQGMTFDLFVQACVTLKHMTDVFKGYDDDRDGYISLSFEEFLSEMLKMLEQSQ